MVSFVKEAFCKGDSATTNQQWIPLIDFTRGVYKAVASKRGQFWDFNVDVNGVEVHAHFTELKSLLNRDLWRWIRRERLRQSILANLVKQKDLRKENTLLKRRLRRKRT
jgi:hypothetical protein